MIGTWDDNGNMLSRSGPEGLTAYTWDFENRLVAVQTPADTLEFGYDDDGIRFYRTVDGRRTDFLIDSNQPYAQVLQERDHPNGTLVAHYLYGHDLLRQDRPASGTGYYHYDAQLSTRFLTDATGTITNTYEYAAFGPFLTRNEPLPNPFTYTGEYFDSETGLLYLRARYLDMNEGRFLSEDPAERNPNRPMDFHFYAYARNNPVLYHDFGGTYIEPSDRFFGTTIHKEIYEDFTEVMVKMGIIPVTNQSVRSVLKKCDIGDILKIGASLIATLPGYLIRPDLVGCSLAKNFYEVDEIKPIYSAPLAAVDLLVYLESLNYYSRQFMPWVSWRAGTAYTPTGKLMEKPIQGWFVVVWREAPGVILYMRSKQRIPVAIPITDKRAKRALKRLAQKVKYAFQQFAPVAVGTVVAAATAGVAVQILVDAMPSLALAF